MSWARLEKRGFVEALAPDKGELDGLRSIVKEKIRDATAAQAAGLSADSRFTLAYDAARNLAMIVVRATGYRPRHEDGGGHGSTFLALKTAEPAFTTEAEYFDTCRGKRHTGLYDYAGGVTDTEADELLKTAQQFAKDAEAWVAARHPHLV
jgi:hypothetical protein